MSGLFKEMTFEQVKALARASSDEMINIVYMFFYDKKPEMKDISKIVLREDFIDRKEIDMTNAVKQTPTKRQSEILDFMKAYIAENGHVQPGRKSPASSKRPKRMSPVHRRSL